MVRGKKSEMDPNAAPKKRGPKPKDANAPAAENPRAAPGGNVKKLEGDEQREAFIQFNGQISVLCTKRDAAEKLVKDALASAKAAGFLKKDFDIARDLADRKKETKIGDDITRRLRVARWLGHKLGDQLDMFVDAQAQPDRTPIVDRAYDEGKQTSMAGQSPKPSYSPDTDAYRAFMAGYHDHQRELAGGFKTLEPRTDEIENKVAKAVAVAPAAPASEMPDIPEALRRNHVAAAPIDADDDLDGGDDDESFDE